MFDFTFFVYVFVCIRHMIDQWWLFFLPPLCYAFDMRMHFIANVMCVATGKFFIKLKQCTFKLNKYTQITIQSDSDMK